MVSVHSIQFHFFIFSTEILAFTIVQQFFKPFTFSPFSLHENYFMYDRAEEEARPYKEVCDQLSRNTSKK